MHGLVDPKHLDLIMGEARPNRATLLVVICAYRTTYSGVGSQMTTSSVGMILHTIMKIKSKISTFYF